MTPYYADDLVTIYHADCREWMPEADLLIADPPYGMNLDTDYSGINGWNGKGKKWDRVVGDDEPFDPTHLLGYRKSVIWGANHFASRLPDSGGWIVWNKRGDGKPSSVAFGDCELAWTNVGQSVRLFSKMWHGVARWSEEPVLHPTQKPVALMLWLIARLSEPGDTVLDPYMGSGPTLVAAKSLGRRAIGIEIEERYCEIAATRCQSGSAGVDRMTYAKRRPRPPLRPLEDARVQLGSCTTNRIELTMRVRLRVLVGDASTTWTTAS